MHPRTWAIRDLLKVSSDYLEEKGIENPRLNAEVLLSHLLGLERVGLYLNFDRPLTQTELSAYRSLIKRRIDHEPLQYITGIQEFWSLNFEVDRRVLIPRSETEIVVEQAVRLLGGLNERARPPQLLDLCTGCGAIAVAIARELPRARLWATDVSDDALTVARKNALTHGVLERIAFWQGDLWGPFTDRPERFDIIVSNPPYVSTEEYDALPPEVRDYEPRQALDGRDGGMYFLERIIQGARDFLDPGGWVILEMSPWQTSTALDIMSRTGAYRQMTRIKDYSRRHRVVMAQTAGH